MIPAIENDSFKICKFSFCVKISIKQFIFLVFQVAHLDVNSVLPPESTRSSNITSLGTSASARPLTYIEMEEQIHALKVIVFL